MVGSDSSIYGVARHDDPEYGCAGNRVRAPSSASQHEGGSLQLYFESRGLYSRERLDGGSLRNPAGVFRRNRSVHSRIDPLRHIEQHPYARHLPHSSRLWRGDDGAGRSSHDGPDIRQIRTDSRHELRCRPGAYRPDAGGRSPAA